MAHWVAEDLGLLIAMHDEIVDYLKEFGLVFGGQDEVVILTMI